MRLPARPHPYAVPAGARAVSSSRELRRGPHGRQARGDRARARDLRQPEAVRRPRRRPAVRGAPRHGCLQGGRRARRQQRAARGFDQRAQLRRLGPGEDARRRDRARLGIGVARLGPRYPARRQPPCRDRVARSAGAGIRRTPDRRERLPQLRGRRRPERHGLPDAIAVRALRSDDLARQPAGSRLLGRARGSVSLARQSRHGAAGRRPQVRHHRHLDRDRDARFARCRRDDRSRAGRHLHRALHDEHHLRAPASRAQRRPRGQRGMVEPRARAEAREQRQRDPGRLLPNSRRGRLPRPGHDPHARPSLHLRRAGLGGHRRLPRPGQRLLRERLLRDPRRRRPGLTRPLLRRGGRERQRRRHRRGGAGRPRRLPRPDERRLPRLCRRAPAPGGDPLVARLFGAGHPPGPADQRRALRRGARGAPAQRNATTR